MRNETQKINEPNPRIVALAGRPNAGKSTLFNALTGARQKATNFPGVTVEKFEGHLKTPDGHFVIVDLPGLRSFSPSSVDEMIATNYLFGMSQCGTPETVLLILDGSCLEDGLYLLSQFRDIHMPVIVVVNMLDTVHASGQSVDLEHLASHLGVPVVGTVATKKHGLSDLLKNLVDEKGYYLKPCYNPNFEPTLQNLIQKTAQAIARQTPETVAQHATYWAKRVIEELGQCGTLNASRFPFSLKVLNLDALEDEVKKVQWQDINAAHVHWAEQTKTKVLKQTQSNTRSAHDRTAAIDRWLMHPIYGTLVFLGIMAFMFQSVYTWAAPLMEGVEFLMGHVQAAVTYLIPEGLLRSFIHSGVIGGIGNFLVFLPQILILFAFITVLEDSGYLPRASALVNRFFQRVGLSGQSFIPLLSSFACAIPGIMATRHISNNRVRLITMILSPMMTCSARLPVYALLIATFIPGITVFGFLNLQGLLFFSLYVLGIVGALALSFCLKHILPNPTYPKPPAVPMPLYRRPSLKTLGMVLKLRSKVFIFKAGKVILVCSMVLWFLGTFPRNEPLKHTLITQGASEATIQGTLLKSSYLGQLGTVIEPVIKPLGFDWKIGIGLISAFAAREVIIGTLGTIYSLGDVDEESHSLRSAMHSDTWADGNPIYTIPTVLSLLVFFAFAMQCMSTLAVLRREANSWVLPVSVFSGMTLLAYVSAWATFSLASLWL